MGLKRILKVPTIADRAWQCLIKYALEPAHEAQFHAQSYGFRLPTKHTRCSKETVPQPQKPKQRKYCKMDGSRFSLWNLNHRTFKVLLKQKTINHHQAEKMVRTAFPSVGYSENKFVNVKGEKSPYDGDINYWSKRNSVLYDGATAKTLRKQRHSCGHCGLKFLDEEKVELHHIDGNHNNWDSKNLLAIHRSCHQYVHMGKGRKD